MCGIIVHIQVAASDTGRIGLNRRCKGTRGVCLSASFSHPGMKYHVSVVKPEFFDDSLSSTFIWGKSHVANVPIDDLRVLEMNQIRRLCMSID